MNNWEQNGADVGFHLGTEVEQSLKNILLEDAISYFVTEKHLIIVYICHSIYLCQIK